MTTFGPPLVEEGLGFDGFRLLSTGLKSDSGARGERSYLSQWRFIWIHLHPTPVLKSLGLKPIRSP
ncbi:MAG: hypothetical protein CM15mP120_09970 [Pseudomonadota bacterium]|nr:MAG: hypothetical protein CM15mP120_09970 [Pseudomonadota bacterium]